MCGRYTLSRPEEVKKRFKVANKTPLFDASFNVSPSQSVPVIVRNSPNRLVLMKWGYVPEWNKKGPGFINIRSESIRDKKYFQRVFKERRCLVPADGFYEWGLLNLEEKDEKYPFYFTLAKSGMFGLAGLYSKVEDAEGKPLYTFAIITCKANSKVKKVHHRMPVILPKKSESIWLDTDSKNPDNPENLLKPYPASAIKYYPVDRSVNNPRNDDEGLITPLEL